MLVKHRLPTLSIMSGIFSFASTEETCNLNVSLVSTYVVYERLSVMHKQVSGWTVNFCPNSPESPFLEFQTRKPPPQWKTSALVWPKFTPKYPPNEKLQIWNDQSLLWNTPPPNWKTSDLGWPKFTPKYPPKMINFRFEMTKVYSEMPPPQIQNFRFEMTKVYSEISPPKWLRIWEIVCGD